MSNTGVFLLLVKFRSHVSVVCHGAVDHMPPEVLKDGCMSTGCDIFSFGVILWELCTGQKPFKGLQQAAIVVAVVEGHRPSIPVNIPSPMVALIQVGNRFCGLHSSS